MKGAGTYPSKIMLVGEYGMVAGGSALTIPFNRYYVRVRRGGKIPGGKAGEAKLSRKTMAGLFRYISSLPPCSFHAAPDLELFSRQMGKVWLEMNIPAGCGLGSSGAVSAALYDLFFPGSDSTPLSEQKADLALIESYFHRESPGVAALTCHAGTSLRFREDGTIQKVDFEPAAIPGGYRFFLLDSGIRFDTGPLVKHFLENLEDPEFADSIRNEYLVINRILIEALLGEREADPGLLVRALSDYQFRNFRRMIPDSVLDLWIEGQVSNEFYLKLNGSGGGFMLGITHTTSTGPLEQRWKEQVIWIE